MTYGLAWAQKPAIWIVTTDSGPVYREVADTVRGEIDRVLPDAVQWVVVPAQQIDVSAPAPKMIITVGSGALAAVAALPADVTAPVLATLLPRLAFDRELGRATKKLTASAIVLDQPPVRQAALIRAALPGARQVGLLLGPESRQMLLPLRSALQDYGFSVHAEDIGQRGMFAALQGILDDSDVVLAIADPAVFNSETISAVLTAGYRRQVPLVAFSPAYVKAGSLLGLYATPSQVGRAAAEATRAMLAGAPLPIPAAPREFSIDLNAAVARSLGLSLREDEMRRRMGATERKP